MSRQFTLHGNERRFALSLAAVAAVLGIGALSVTYAFGAPAPTASGHRNTALDARRGSPAPRVGRPPHGAHVRRGASARCSRRVERGPARSDS
jgi:hypothetical protein